MDEIITANSMQKPSGKLGQCSVQSLDSSGFGQNLVSDALLVIRLYLFGTLNPMNWLPDTDDIKTIVKPGIGVFIAMTAYVGFMLSDNYFTSHLYIHLAVFVLSFVASGGSAAVNMILERETDKHMDRTKNRPLPTGRMTVKQAVVIAACWLSSGLGLAYILNFWFFLFLFLGGFVYVFVYTMWLKPRSTWNVSIGGLSGTFAALAGGYATTEQFTFNTDVWLLAAFLFLWSPAHFWNLGIYKREEYKKVDFPMLPASTSVAKGVFWILMHVLGLIVVSAAFSVWGDRSLWFNLGFLPFNFYFLFLASKNFKKPDDALSKRTFLFSILYLFAAYIALGLDVFVARLV